jgi:hypothetical protein
MASGRNQVDYTDINFDAITAKADGVTLTFDATQANGIPATVLGRALTWSGNDTVALAADGDHVCGKLIKLENTGGVVWVTMQHIGFATFGGGNGAVLTRGKAIVGAIDASSNKGFIREVATATAAEIGRQRGRIVNNADTTAVVVQF